MPAVDDLPLAGAPAHERKDAARNRVRVLDAAQRVLAREGPDGLTMDAVAAEAGVGKGTIFRRFGDREGLAEALIDGPMRELQERVLRGPPPLGPGAPAGERLEAFATELARFIDEHLDVVSVAAAAPGHRRSAAFGFLLVHTQLLLREAAPHLDEAVAARLLLGAVSAPVVADACAHGADIEAIAASVRTLVRGLTRPASSDDRFT
jgi:AcrR family transcriptional regulator